jgi:hypothetical protein
VGTRSEGSPGIVSLTHGTLQQVLRGGLTMAQKYPILAPMQTLTQLSITTGTPLRTLYFWRDRGWLDCRIVPKPYQESGTVVVATPQAVERARLLARASARAPRPNSGRRKRKTLRGKRK